VLLVGVASEGNRSAIERHGGVRILAELPLLAPLSSETIAQAAGCLPGWELDRAA
jgi:malonyl-CoA O-methyltransferase